MLSKEIIKKIKNLEIYTRRLLSGMHVGDYSTAQKGSGFEFDQLTEYQQGDDVRFIDWKGSARASKLLVRKYLEERNRTIFLFVDVSSSSFYSSEPLLRYEVMAQIAGVIALVGDYGKDHVGLVLFSDQVEKVVSPGRGRKHMHSIMETLFSWTETSDQTKKTDLNIPFSYLSYSKQKGILAFVISDFIGDDFEKSLRVAQKKYEIVAIRCLDRNEQEFPAVGFLTIQDIESGKKIEIDTNKKTRMLIKERLHERIKQQDKLFGKYAIDILDIKDNKYFIANVIRFFRRRMMY